MGAKVKGCSRKNAEELFYPKRQFLMHEILFLKFAYHLLNIFPLYLRCSDIKTRKTNNLQIIIDADLKKNFPVF